MRNRFQGTAISASFVQFVREKTRFDITRPEHYERLLRERCQNVARFSTRGYVKPVPLRPLKEKEQERQQQWERQIIWCARCGLRRVKKSAFVCKRMRCCSACLRYKRNGKYRPAVIKHDRRRSRAYTTRLSKWRARQWLRSGMLPPSTSLYCTNYSRIADL